jgi:hypothetical protein
MKVVRITLYSVPLKIGMNLTRYVADQIIARQNEVVICSANGGCCFHKNGGAVRDGQSRFLSMIGVVQSDTDNLRCAYYRGCEPCVRRCNRKTGEIE